ncbi:hypothetical protein NDU88_009281 [Pleurodeles waltl]|uniref:Uncharacterized protein n=1 Tax=Pleurodeles waltl TaxID=8319 RepID=A0AAV7P083_PLEWA|nr:hypothetical protein NDU88_009281 [Pleurodeles waltl]
MRHIRMMYEVDPGNHLASVHSTSNEEGETGSWDKSESVKCPYHVNAREQLYPDSNINRFPVPDEMVPWQVEFLIYDPPFHIAVREDRDVFGPLTRSPRSLPKRNYNALDGLIDLRSSCGTYMVQDGVPLNPMGRTGIRGIGSLRCYGPNHSLHPVLTRIEPEEQNQTMFSGPVGEAQRARDCYLGTDGASDANDASDTGGTSDANGAPDTDGASDIKRALDIDGAALDTDGASDIKRALDIDGACSDTAGAPDTDVASDIKHALDIDGAASDTDSILDTDGVSDTDIALDTDGALDRGGASDTDGALILMGFRMLMGLPILILFGDSNGALDIDGASDTDGASAKDGASYTDWDSDTDGASGSSDRSTHSPIKCFLETAVVRVNSCGVT